MRKFAAILAFVALLAPALPAAAAPAFGALIKRADDAAVYYYGSDGKRYVFPNEKTYKTWYANFSAVQVVTAVELGNIPIGGNVTYRPGVKMVKIQSDPRTYAVSRGSVLRHVASESLAVSLFGSGWASLVEDLPDAFFVNYQVGAEISAAQDYDRNAELAAATSINSDKGLGEIAPPTVSASAPHVGNCQVFPSDNPWNTDISGAPVHPNSAAYIASIGSAGLHPDFGEDPSYGIPYDVVGAGQAKVPIAFTDYGDESDPGPYPIPPDATVESGSDAHVLVVDKDACVLYELFGAEKSGSGWNAASGAVFDLKSNALRPEGWTSADAAGLPIFPGLVRYDEVKSGAINHALRFTASPTQEAYIHPATHWASSSTNAAYPPMGLRVRLKASYDISGFTGDARVILEAMKKYGMLLADNGGDWFFQGEKGAAWDDDNLNTLKSVPGSAFEAVETGPLVKP
ncbi:MAG TPA: hypothetical protein VL283_00680 [Candidatus Baltobacteraceae bacterium]|nr:hypothetical protein [Candidatus Baltobacteraceae bacterium]